MWANVENVHVPNRAALGQQDAVKDKIGVGAGGSGSSQGQKRDHRRGLGQGRGRQRQSGQQSQEPLMGQQGNTKQPFLQGPAQTTAMPVTETAGKLSWGSCAYKL